MISFSYDSSHIHVVAMIASNDLSQEILAMDMLTAIKSPLDDSSKHVRQLSRLYGGQAFAKDVSFLMSSEDN